MTASNPDEAYAKGEITREQWMQSRTTTLPPPPPAGPQPRAPRPSRSLFLVFAVVIVVVVAAVVAYLIGPGSGGLPATYPSYQPLRQLGASDLAALNASATTGTAYGSNNSLWFAPGPVTLVVYASPPLQDMAFDIQGMSNPAIHVAAGSRITVIAVNMDAGEYHTWTLTSVAPPYSSMPMMGSGGMMGSGTMMGTGMMGYASTQGYWSQQVSFTAPAGSFWYICAVSGHASAGMYGAFVGA